METESNIPGEKPRRSSALLLGLAAIAVVVVWWSTRPPASTEKISPDVARPAIVADARRVERPPSADVQTTPQVDLAALLMPTPSPTSDPANALALISETVSIIPLPTVTPAPTPAPLSPLDIEIDGRATISMSMSGVIAESSGRPLRMTIPVRLYHFDATHLRHLDRWCIPMGIVHTVVELDLVVDPATEIVLANGTVSLFTDYCDNPGDLADQSSFDFEISPEQTVPLVQYLESKRELLAVPNLLDTEAEASVNLNFTSSKPAQ